MSVTVAAVPTTRRHDPPPGRVGSPISNARLAVAALIVAEVMLFTALVGAYLVIRLTPATWPPPDLPTLPIGLTAFNTLLLLGSMAPMHLALRAIRTGDQARGARAIVVAASLGVVFLLIQGFEWSRLVVHGLTLQTGSYGGAFYLLIGCHALHVFAAVLWLVVVCVGTVQGRFTAARHDTFEACAIFWYFVCLLWAGLFPLAYLY